MKRQLSPSECSIVERQENVLIDAQFRIHDLMMIGNRKRARARLAAKVGITEAELSQFFAPEADPELKLVQALLQTLGQVNAFLTNGDENLPVDVRAAILELLRKQKIGRAKLADKCGIGKKRLCRFLEAKVDLRLKQVVALFFALGKRDLCISGIARYNRIPIAAL
jgi:DNA-binding phage protein